MRQKLQRRHLLGALGAIGLSAATGMSGCATAASNASRRFSGADGDQPTLELAQGRLRGRRTGDVVAFKRIPYAPDPFVAERRFLPPGAPPSWSGIREADTFGPMPPQPARGPGGLAGAADDLTLNIWAPASGPVGLPVMVWLPGGGFFRADAAEGWYDGSAFARDGVVLVSVNYRVGVDGFMAVQGGAANAGLLDQIAALQWVKANIAAVGGDPDNVTVSGQSAGAEAVLLLLGMPQARGLFRRAISESPAVVHHTPEQAHRVAAATAALLGVPPTREGLGSVPLPALIGAVESMTRDLRDTAKWGAMANQPPYLPVIDGQVLTASPLVALRSSSLPEVATLIGCNDEEARLYLVPGGAIDRVSDADVERFARAAGLPAGALGAYRAARPSATAGDLLAALDSDRTFRMPAVRFAENRVQGRAPVWLYQFGWKSPAFGGRLGASHVLDVPFVFDTLQSEAARPFVGTGAPQSLADTMHAAWVRFAKTGNPGWATYDLARRTTMRFDTASIAVDDPGRQERELWAGLSFE